MAGLNVGSSQTISGSTSQHGEYKGHGIGAHAQGGPTAPLPLPAIPESAVPAPVAAQAPWWFNQKYYYCYNNYGTSSIEGNTKQDGTFKGHGTGASVQGGFTASGDIK